MKDPNISTQYSENSKEIVVTVFRNRKPVTKVITCKKTKNTYVRVFTEHSKTHIEEYQFNINDKENNHEQH